MEPNPNPADLRRAMARTNGVAVVKSFNRPDLPIAAINAGGEWFEMSALEALIELGFARKEGRLNWYQLTENGKANG